MKIKNLTVNRSNFIPFVLFLVTYYFGNSLALYISVRTITSNMQSFSEYLFGALFSLPYAVILTFIAQYIMTKRLQREEPKKIFYTELPALVTIYSLLDIFNISFGLLVGGPEGLTRINVLSLVGIPVIFIIIWLSSMSAYLYRYSKRT